MNKDMDKKDTRSIPVLSLFKDSESEKQKVSIEVSQTANSQLNKICEAIKEDTGKEVSYDDLIRFLLYSTGIMHMVGKKDKFPQNTDEIVLPLAEYVNEECDPEKLLDPN